MNLCWVVTAGLGGHVRDVDPHERDVLLRDGYEEFRLSCITPSGTREGLLYVQACKTSESLASHVEMGGLALFGGCTTMEVHRPGNAAAVPLPPSNLAVLMKESESPRTGSR